MTHTILSLAKRRNQGRCRRDSPAEDDKYIIHIIQFFPHPNSDQRSQGTCPQDPCRIVLISYDKKDPIALSKQLTKKRGTKDTSPHTSLDSNPNSNEKMSSSSSTHNLKLEQLEKHLQKHLQSN